VAAEAQVALATRWERLLDLDHDLADALGEEIVARARDRIGVATVRLAPGSWHPSALTEIGREAFALIVCDGLIVRDLDLAGTLTADLLGPGDLVDFGPGIDPLLSTGERWQVSGHATVAILDDRVLPALHAWPAVSSRLIARAARQAARAAEQRAISQLPRVELRIRALLWHLAERWGRVGSSGVVVPLELTHEALGHLVGARRPTITLALGELSRRGAVTRRADGAWVLRADSNPSEEDQSAVATAGVGRLVDTGRGVALRALPAPPTNPEGAILADRIERLRAATAHERARTLALLDECRATSTRARDGRLTSPPAR
jgi:CRP/FNR family transcriptional regulator, cyclic AMP receptor protein